jgi:thiol-disulfide isomerase/thioredoxin
MNSWKGLMTSAVVATVIVVLMSASISCRWPRSEAEGLVGETAPEISSDFALNGKPLRLSDLKGKVILLDFWATWCGPCVAALPHMVEFNHKYKARGLEVIGVTQYADDDHKPESQARLAAFADKHDMDYLLLVLTSRQMEKAAGDYRVTGIPEVVLIDRRGVIRYVGVGASAEEIEDKAKELLAEK